MMVVLRSIILIGSVIGIGLATPKAIAENNLMREVVALAPIGASEIVREQRADGSVALMFTFYDEVVGDNCASGKALSADGEIYDLGVWCGDDLLPFWGEE